MPAVAAHQVFLNLLVNASHAIDANGTFTLATGIEGTEAWVRISDTGAHPARALNGCSNILTTKPVAREPDSVCPFRTRLSATTAGDRVEANWAAARALPSAADTPNARRRHEGSETQPAAEFRAAA